MDLISRILNDSLVNVFGSCLPNGLFMTVNNKTFRILKLLGEGGFSTVYLVRDVATSKEYAVKKIFCSHSDPEAFQMAFREVEINQLFNHPNISPVLDICTENQADGNRLVYLFFEYYKKGSLQDAIVMNLASQTFYTENEALTIFYDICQAVYQLHRFRRTNVLSMRNPVHNHNTSESSAIPDGSPTSPTLDYLPCAHRDIKPG